MSYYDELLAQVSNWPLVRKEDSRYKLRENRGLSATWEAYRAYTQMLTDPNTKRLLFDSRQAVVFGDLAEPPPQTAQHILHTPFDQFYLELTEPILFGEPEAQHQDYIRAFLYSSNAMTGKVPAYDTGEELPFSLASITVFLSSIDDGRLALVDRTWKLHLQMGMPFVTVAAATADPDPSETGSLGRTQYFLAGAPLLHLVENRHIGWWERLTVQYTQLWSWMMLYCMAKGIYIEQEPLSRQQRRWHEQHPKLPQPWHIVKVEPKFVSKHAEEGEGFHHSYRYDVIGHLRFGKHPVGPRLLPQGESRQYHDIVEWVAPHQRGLANTLYVPKTYKVEPGKAIHPRFKEYASAEKGGGS